MTHDPFNAFVDRDPAARAGEGPLADLTIGVKSNIAVKGLPWTGGMAHRRQVIAQVDAAVVAKLRAAGATILGTLNMHEAALGATTDNAFYGRTENPHRAGYTPGGSSGGSGAAVAAGLCDLALGTDTLGSVRIPAAFCGIYGLKPSERAINDVGLIPLEPKFDAIGLLARDLDTIERAWAVVGSGARARSLERAVILDDLGATCEPAVRAAYDRALMALGLPRSPLHLPSSTKSIREAALARTGRVLREALGAHVDQASQELQKLLIALEAIGEDEALLAATRALVRGTLGQDGVLVMPTTPQAAFAHGTRSPPSQADFTGLANIAGLPALAVPAGTNADNLPIGVQLVGPMGSERELVGLARQLEPILGGFVPPPPAQGE